MIINLIIIAFIIVLSFIYNFKYGPDCNTYAIRKKYIKVISIVLILQSGLRNIAVGSDTYNYYTYFEEVKQLSWSDVFNNFKTVYVSGEGKDAGYIVFEKLVSILTTEYQVLLMVIAILFFYALGNFLLKNTTKLNDAMMAFIIYSVLFYAFFSITGHRQTIATAGSLFAFEFIKKKKLIPFLLLIIVAATIHKSVVLFIPFYFIAHIKNIKHFNWSILMLFPVFMVARNQISTYFKVLAGYEEYGEYEGAGSFIFTFIFLIIVIAALIRSNIILKNNKNARYAFNAFGVALLFLPLTWVNPSAMRVVQYFSIFMLILIPEIINSFDEISIKFKRGVQNGLIIVLLALFIKSNLTTIPYGFFWEDMQKYIVY
jgi:hypothetical protein